MKVMSYEKNFEGNIFLLEQPRSELIPNEHCDSSESVDDYYPKLRCP
jgi:hypothetical protein